MVVRVVEKPMSRKNVEAALESARGCDALRAVDHLLEDRMLSTISSAGNSRLAGDLGHMARCNGQIELLASLRHELHILGGRSEKPSRVG
jgi:hypothetical protein